MVQKIFFLLCFTFAHICFPLQVLAGDNNNHTVDFYSTKLSISKEDVMELIIFSNEMKVDFELVYQLIGVETGGTFNHKAVGPLVKHERALGIAQFMPSTANWIAEMYHINYSNKKLFDAFYSIKLSICYLNFLQYGGKEHFGYYDWDATLTAYNRGIKGLECYKNNTGTFKSSYSNAVLKHLY